MGIVPYGLSLYGFFFTEIQIDQHYRADDQRDADIAEGNLYRLTEDQRADDRRHDRLDGRDNRSGRGSHVFEPQRIEHRYKHLRY